MKEKPQNPTTPATGPSAIATPAPSERRSSIEEARAEIAALKAQIAHLQEHIAQIEKIQQGNAELQRHLKSFYTLMSNLTKKVNDLEAKTAARTPSPQTPLSSPALQTSDDQGPQSQGPSALVWTNGGLHISISSDDPSNSAVSDEDGKAFLRTIIKDAFERLNSTDKAQFQARFSEVIKDLINESNGTEIVIPLLKIDPTTPVEQQVNCKAQNLLVQAVTEAFRENPRVDVRARRNSKEHSPTRPPENGYHHHAAPGGSGSAWSDRVPGSRSNGHGTHAAGKTSAGR